jgi:hypothetical protein
MYSTSVFLLSVLAFPGAQERQLSLADVERLPRAEDMKVLLAFIRDEATKRKNLNKRERQLRQRLLRGNDPWAGKDFYGLKKVEEAQRRTAGLASLILRARDMELDVDRRMDALYGLRKLDPVAYATGNYRFLWACVVTQISTVLAP